MKFSFPLRKILPSSGHFLFKMASKTKKCSDFDEIWFSSKYKFYAVVAILDSKWPPKPKNAPISMKFDFQVDKGVASSFPVSKFYLVVAICRLGIYMWLACNHNQHLLLLLFFFFFTSNLSGVFLGDVWRDVYENWHKHRFRPEVAQVGFRIFKMAAIFEREAVKNQKISVRHLSGLVLLQCITYWCQT